MNELKPCPFCDSENVELIFSSSSYVVVCHECNMEGPIANQAMDPYCDQNAAIDIWNKRA